jgi:glycerol kinase
MGALGANWRKDAEWRPAIKADAHDRAYAQWKKTVTRTMDWID